MRRICIWFYILLQCTWGIFQTSLGFFLFLRYFKCHHSFFGGAVHTRWNRNGGVSLGLFIFSPESVEKENQTELPDGLVIHEYGHTFQSLMLGPLYLLIIGIPSVIWANGKKYVKLREMYGVPYSFLFAESWADKLGHRMTKIYDKLTSGRKDR